MSNQIIELAQQAGYSKDFLALGLPSNLERFVMLLKQAIYEEVREELIDDALISIEADSLTREYLKGCNGGIVDALIRIKNFGVKE